MKVYKLEFTFYDMSDYDYKTVYITAISMFQLMKQFLIETKHIKESYGSRYLTKKELWNRVKDRIIYEDLNFPIVNTYLNDY